MKSSSALYKSAGVCFLATFLSAVSSYAGDDGAFYMAIDGGASVVQDAQSAHGPGFGPDGTVVSFDTGARFDVTAGYRFRDFLAGEVEGGFADNKISTDGGISTPTDWRLYQYPLLFNVVLRQPIGHNWAASIGGGVGGVWTDLDIQGLGSDTDLQLAYQFKAGLTYSFGDVYEFGITYRYLGTDDHTWTIAGIPSGTKGIMTHSFVVSLTIKF